MQSYGIITPVEFKSSNVVGIFYFPRCFPQSNTFGAKAPDFTLAQRESPCVLLLNSTLKSSVRPGAFVFLRRDRVKEFFTVSEQWQGRVYQINPDSKYVNPDGSLTPYWQEIREEVLKDDNFTCQRCGNSKSERLSAHHVIPRALGGGDNIENLIALCGKCHDEVEILGYFSKWQIINMFDEEAPDDETPETTDEWQGWVYGAKRRHRK